MADGVTFGVEEEFLLVDPTTWRVTPRAGEVLAGIPPDVRGFVHEELHRTQIEISTPVCRDLAELRTWLAHLRGCAVAAAEAAGCRLLAAGTALLDYPGTPPLTAGDRYARMAADFGALVEVQGLCASHVHVGVRDRELAVAVSNRIRHRMPLLHALCTNSPFADGRDTGYASWRTVLWGRWPTAGPAPWWRSAAHYDQVTDDLVACGAMLDPQMAYWYTRPSSRYPTIEARVGDVCATIDETILVAALVRAIVATAVDDVRTGRPVSSVDDRMLLAAHWRAARHGTEGLAVDLVHGGLRPVWDLVEELVRRVEPALTARGDARPVARLMRQIRSHGSAAARQRAVYARTADLTEVAKSIVEETRRDAHAPGELTATA